MAEKFQFRKASRGRKKLRLALIGPSGSGKTIKAILWAREIFGPSARIAVIDTENESASLYCDVADYDVLQLKTYHPFDYIEAIEAAEDAGYDVIVIDSGTHEWSGKGGILDQKDKLGGRFQDWAQLTPMHQAFVDKILKCKSHVIATFRAKQQYVVTGPEKGQKGKPTVDKLGVGAVARDGTEYEFDIVGDVDQRHRVKFTKTRCLALDRHMFGQEDNAKACEIIRDWLGSDDAAPAAPVGPAPEVDRIQETSQQDGDPMRPRIDARIEKLRAFLTSKPSTDGGRTGGISETQFLSLVAKYGVSSVAGLSDREADEVRRKLERRAEPFYSLGGDPAEVGIGPSDLDPAPNH